ncbi:alginate lyase family protein [Yoonia sp. GPGPB17]|uniref:heparinase II/III family protein n=1 Tax=Yoonia sp. GPGPB17 TaxID=3026147 RepID=UPI0030BE0B1D
MLGRVGLLWRTLRYLQPVQIFGRVYFRMMRPRPNFLPGPRPRAGRGPYRDVARRSARMLGPTKWRFLNEDGELTEIGWQNDQRSKLWRYNQHYFDDLNAEAGQDRLGWHMDLVAIWIKQNPAAHGQGWEPYPTSLRIVNWVKWTCAGQTLTPDMMHSLAVQTRWLTKRLEWHLLGNHLFANAKALVHAGLFFEGPEAEKWLEKGLAILAKELPEQILSDGGQFELTPMYHALALEDLLDLVNIASAYPEAFAAPARSIQVDHWRQTIPAMLRWLLAMSHPDGRIALFSDAAFDIAPSNTALYDYASRLGFARPVIDEEGILDLPASGFSRLAKGSAVLLADLARIGPDYLPGHGHADTLSFELSVYGQRVFVNSGTSVYGLGQERQRQRGTPAHNTVTVNGANSSEVWSGFRVGARARILDRRVVQDDNVLLASASHDGYGRVVTGLKHKRDFRLTTRSLTINDQISRPAQAEARFHLHPAVKATLSSKAEGHLLLPDGQKLSFRVEPGALRLEPATWHPEFGISQDTHCLVAALDDQHICLTLEWP